MSDFVENDTGSVLRVLCTEKSTKAALNLSGATVRLKWKVAGVLTVRVMTITDAANGIAEYKFALGELRPTLKEAEVEVTLANGDVVTGLSRVKLAIAPEIT
jgi:hypothetical protein